MKIRVSGYSLTAENIRLSSFSATRFCLSFATWEYATSVICGSLCPALCCTICGGIPSDSSKDMALCFAGAFAV